MLNNLLFNEISVLQLYNMGSNIMRHLNEFVKTYWLVAFDISSLTFDSELIAKFDIQSKPTVNYHKYKYKLKAPRGLEGFCIYESRVHDSWR